MAHSLDPTLRTGYAEVQRRCDLQRKRTEYLQLTGATAAAGDSKGRSKPGDAGCGRASTTTSSGLKFYGYAGPKNGGKKIFLIKGEDIFLAKEGDVVDRRYKIVRVGTHLG